MFLVSMPNDFSCMHTLCFWDVMILKNISPNVDIVHYEWSYFEHGGAAEYHESLIRWTQMLPKQPPVHIFNTGILVATNNNDDQFCTLYAKYGFNVWYQMTGFTNGGYDYESEKKLDPPLDRFAWGQHGDGYHTRTRYGELETDEIRKESLEVVMRNWHPGPLAFQLTADAFSYVYAKAIHKALELIEKDINDGYDPRDKWSASERPMLLKRDLPEPISCDPTYCTLDEPPGCLNFELPTYGNWGARIEDPTDSLNPHLGEVQKWSLWHEDNDIWKLVAKEDISYFKDRDDKEICRHLDACGGISAQKVDDGMVVFRLPKMEVGLVVICGCCGKDVGENMFKSNPNIDILYNTVKLDPNSFDIWPNPKCVRLLKRFPTSGRESETPTGHAYLAINVTQDMSQVIRVSHVITV
ncbi:hypothetical protein HJC23_002201 [Cyclotella cryptica]|uniref:Uncharacterized protein n=1 Tax=Cyclotella cryptica TaxID=29204 RepID=A0ABD3QCQ1_9STRA